MRVVLTQQRAGAKRAARRLAVDGVETIVCPLIRVEPLEGPPIHVDGYDWVVLTSRTAVGALLARLEGELPRVAVVGRGTADALRAHGIEPDLVASRSTQEGLVAELPRPAGRVLFPAAEGARDTIVRELGADFVPLYRTVEEDEVGLPEADLVVLASASAARALARLGKRLPIVSIGPVTTAEARKLGLDVVAEAPTHDLDGLAAAVKLAQSSARSSPS